MAIHVLGLLRARVRAGTGREHHRIAAGEGITHVALKIGDHNLCGTERAHLVTLRFIANHGACRVCAFGHLAHQALADIAVRSNDQYVHVRPS